MSVDRIQLLSESLCNLVRAQEVVSNPAAAVKELLDNAIDAGATSIQLDILGSGKSAVHVIDNGCGMSPIDARMAFERHATSKIHTKEDLENIQTLGFRGEGLASIATVSRVELRTRREEDEIGTEVTIAGGEFVKQTPVAAPLGTSIKMSDIYYNVPGRRRSLKRDAQEEKYIDEEFTQSALAHPNIGYQYYKGGTLFKELRPSSLKERILAVAGRSLEKKLLSINYKSQLISITGFCSHPDQAVKSGKKQFFFVNNRYIRHEYFRKAIEQVFEPLIPQGCHPHFFIYFTVPSDHLDVNIHPSKKEVRFIDEPFIYTLLRSLIREALSLPEIDWDNPSTIEIPSYSSDNKDVEVPSTTFKTSSSGESSYVQRVFMSGADSVPRGFSTSPQTAKVVSSNSIDWDNLESEFTAGKSKEGLDVTQHTEHQTLPLEGATSGYALRPLQHGVFQGDDFPTIGSLIYKGRYIVSTLRRSLALIDLRRAHIRVLYEQYLRDFEAGQVESQALMFAEEIDVSVEEREHATRLIEDLSRYGFVFELQDDAHYRIIEAPSVLVNNVVEVVQSLLADCLEHEEHNENALREQIALYLANAQAYAYGARLERCEIDDLIANLFASSNPNYDPHQRRIISLIDEVDIDSRFN